MRRLAYPLAYPFHHVRTSALPIERTDVSFPLWRKKVDGSLVRLGYTPLPIWVVRMWGITDEFANVRSRSDPAAKIRCIFNRIEYGAEVVPHRGGRQHRLFLPEALRVALAATFPMSYLRELDNRLAHVAGEQISRSREDTTRRAFWEFVDLEFDVTARRMQITAHYVQRPDFPNVFSRLVGSAPLKAVEDEATSRRELRIHKQPWRPRHEYELEIGARNVVYTLIDCVNGLIYVGEADDMVARFNRGHTTIRDWTHYRYNLLPPELAPLRRVIERMAIRDMDSVLGGGVKDLPIAPGAIRLTNLRIDR